MHKISPTLNACKQFKQNVNQKKVHFDSARVAFQVSLTVPPHSQLPLNPLQSQPQVEYDIPDDKSLKKSIPLWTEHWKKSKTGLIRQLLSHVTCRQWTVVFITLTSLIALTIQLSQSLDQYLQRATLLSGQYTLPDHFQWPSVSLCRPLAVPLNTRCLQNTSDCQTIERLFNQSSDLFHRCKHNHVSDNRLNACSPPLQWFFRNRKCFTYFSRFTPNSGQSSSGGQSLSISLAKHLAISLLISTPEESQESIHLFVHKTDFIPFESQKLPQIDVKRETDLKIQFFSTTFDHKRDPKTSCSQFDRQMASPFSHSDCFSRCLLVRMRAECQTSGDIFGQNHCLSRLALIRRDLISASEQFCTSRDDNDCNSHQFYQQLEAECRHLCPEDCTQQEFHLSVGEHLSRDSSEVNVSFTRQLTPDLNLWHVPQTTCLQLLAQLGGLAAFWLIFLWILLSFLKLCQFFWELIEIYYL